jgi:hypothetical protein
MTNAAPGKGKTALSLKINSDSTIVTQNTSVNQLLLSIHIYRLAEVIQTLESSGFTGDLAIFFIASLQILEAGA